MTAKVSWRDAQARRLNALTDVERIEYNYARDDAELRMDLAELIYEARLAAGLSQTELAARAGTRQSVISAIENGAQVPGFSILNRIASAVGAPLEIRVGQQKVVVSHGSSA